MVQLAIHKSSGQLVTKIIDQIELREGEHIKRFPAHRLEAGVYFISLKTNTEKLVERLIIITD